MSKQYKLVFKNKLNNEITILFDMILELFKIAIFLSFYIAIKHLKMYYNDIVISKTGDYDKY